MHIEPKAADNEVCRKYYGADNQSQAKNLKTSIVSAPQIKSFVELAGGEIVDEELTETIKVTADVLTSARQILAGGA